MLLEFRVGNFRSFNEESVLSLIASTDNALADTNTAETGIAAIPRAVRSAAVYGANASGKSNLLRAMHLMRNMVLGSTSLNSGEKLDFQPFRFNEDRKTEPTLLEMTFILDGVRHQYGFEFTQDRIINEWLFVYQKAKPQRWIDRHYDPETGEYTFNFSPFLAGQKQTWKSATRKDALFLSTAVQFNSEHLKPIYLWFMNLIVLMSNVQLSHDYSTALIKDKIFEKDIRSIMTAADIAIAQIRAVSKKTRIPHLKINQLTGTSVTAHEEVEIFEPRFTREAGGTKADFSLDEESDGTQKLFALAGPLLDILAGGKTLAIDELDRSLHPLLVRHIINAFQDPALNKRGAQLLFTTHDTSLLDSKLLRRDQIWFTEKNSDQSSSLTPLTDFSPRRGEALERGYLGGRYGGVPVLDPQLIAGNRRG